jgi:hypothetical protein
LSRVIWLDGIAHILAHFHEQGRPASDIVDWADQWWGAAGPVDIVPSGRTLFIVKPAQFPPFSRCSSAQLVGPDRARIVRAEGSGRYREILERKRNVDGTVFEMWQGGFRLVSETTLASELQATYA